MNFPNELSTFYNLYTLFHIKELQKDVVEV